MSRRILLGVLIVLLVVPAGAIVFEHWRGRRLLARTITELEQRGEVLDLQKLVPAPVSPVDNAFDALLSVASRLRIPSGIAPQALEMIEPLRALPGTRREWWVDLEDRRRTWTDLTAWLTSHSTDLDTLLACARAPHRAPTADYLQGFNVSAFAMGPLRDAVAALSVSAADAARRDDFNHLIASLEAMRTVDRDLAAQPPWLAQLLRVAIAAGATARTWDISHARPWTEDQLAAIHATLVSEDLAASTVRSLEFERALALVSLRKYTPRETWWTIEAALAGGSQDPGSLPQIPDSVMGAAVGLWKFMWEDRAMAHYLRAMQEVLEVHRKASQQRSFAVLNALAIHRLTAAHSPVARLRCAYTRVLLPSFDKAARSAFRHDVEKALLETEIALRRFRARQGRWPAKLDELVPEFIASVPIDRMNGEPLRYRTNPDGGFTLWSVGDDFIDHGGDPSWSDPQKKWQHWWSARDWVWPRVADDAAIAEWTQAQLEKLARPGRRTGQEGQVYTMNPELMRRYGLLPATTPQPGATNLPAANGE
jgi:hypothetical protein